jgi:hypothetical protein
MTRIKVSNTNKIIQKKLQEIPARVVNPIDGEKHHRK